MSILQINHLVEFLQGASGTSNVGGNASQAVEDANTVVDVGELDTASLEFGGVTSNSGNVGSDTSQASR